MQLFEQLAQAKFPAPGLIPPAGRIRPTSELLLCGDCIDLADRYLADESVDLLICDPPFGIREGRFGSQYNRKAKHVIPGYVEAPADYGPWTVQWLTRARRVLKPDGSLYVFAGHSNLRHVLNGLHDVGFHLINQIVWQFPFGVVTKRKFVTAHYNVLYCSKSPKAGPTFNPNCRFADTALDARCRSLRYQDMQDVWQIPREYHTGLIKNANKLPHALIEKIIAYSSNPGDIVGDFFLGNFTTARAAFAMDRIAIGFEQNQNVFDPNAIRLWAKLVTSASARKAGAHPSSATKIAPDLPRKIA